MKTLEKIKVNPESAESLTMNFMTYTCTNHPEVIVSDPGKCPDCGKALVQKILI